jgi:hypothetical protein
LFIKIDTRRKTEEREFNALAVLYRRQDSDSSKVIVEDAVSFGSDALSRDSRESLPNDLIGLIRYLPPVRIAPRELLAKDPCRGSYR